MAPLLGDSETGHRSQGPTFPFSTQPQHSIKYEYLGVFQKKCYQVLAQRSHLLFLYIFIISQSSNIILEHRNIIESAQRFRTLFKGYVVFLSFWCPLSINSNVLKYNP